MPHILRWAPYLLFLGLLVLCGYLVARLSWQFATPATAAAPTRPDDGSQVVADAVGKTPGERIVAAHLFGTAKAPATAAARNAPETTLNLGLAGVAASNKKDLSYAIVTSDNNQTNTYAVGAKLPDGALIRQVLPNRIILAHNGHLETLRLPNTLPAGAKTGKGGSKTNANATTRQTPFVRPRHALASSANSGWKLVRNPKNLAQYVRLRPYSAGGGRIQGYRAYPGANPALFQKAGLKPGDVITKVNGVSLDNPAGVKKAFTQLRESKGPIRLTIWRNDHKLHLTVNFGG